MKNHVWSDGRLLQTNKKWFALKQSQRMWIHGLTSEEHAAYVKSNGRLPMKKRKDELIDRIFARLDERGIWIPYREFRSHVAVMIDKLNHASPLFKPPTKRTAPPKPVTPKADMEEFPEDVQADIREKFAAGIRRYILQAHRIPPNRIRDAEVKNMLRGFNVKQWKQHGKQLQSSDTLLELYGALRQEIFTELDGTGAVPDKISASKRKALRASAVFLETERLTLRKMNGRDYKDIRDMLADPDVMAAWERVYTTKKEVMDWIIRQMRRYEKELTGYFLAVDRAGGEAVGQIGLMWNNIRGRRCLEVGYILKKAHWGKGYAAEGAKACMEYGFELFGVDKIYAAIRPENMRSRAVAERIGMASEGEFTKTHDGKKIKHLVYSREKHALSITEHPEE